MRRTQAAAIVVCVGLGLGLDAAPGAGLGVGLGAGLQATAQAQGPGQQIVAPGASARGGGPMAGMAREFGEVVSVSGQTVLLKTLADGKTVTVVTTDNTRMMAGQGVPLKLADLKPGSGVMAAGQMDEATHTLHALMLFSTTPEDMQRMQAQLKVARENLGKTYITGKVMAVDLDNGKLTLQRPDGKAQTIGLDESTSFKKGARVMGAGALMGMGAGGGMRVRRGDAGGSGQPPPPPVSTTPGQPQIEGGESITLADVKAGDSVTGVGGLKGGVFVPTVLNVNVRRERPGPGAPEFAPGAGPQPPQ